MTRDPALEKYIVRRGTTESIRYAGLLAVAHERGLRSLSVHMVQCPTDGNGWTAICEAVAVFDLDGKPEATFTDIADANVGNCNAQIGPAFIRMAATRAKARCLRDGLNVDLVSTEELADALGLGGDVDHAPAPTVARPPRAVAASATENLGPLANAPRPEPSVDTAPASDTQKDAITKLLKKAGKVLADDKISALTRLEASALIMELSGQKPAQPTRAGSATKRPATKQAVQPVQTQMAPNWEETVNIGGVDYTRAAIWQTYRTRAKRLSIVNLVQPDVAIDQLVAASRQLKSAIDQQGAA